jgi:hypothetical protein
MDKKVSLADAHSIFDDQECRLEIRKNPILSVGQPPEF